MANWTSALSIFIYTSAVVLIIVGGQTPTDVVEQLASAVARLQTELAEFEARNEKLEAEQAEMRAELAKAEDKIVKLADTTPTNRICCNRCVMRYDVGNVHCIGTGTGVTYIRWGRRTCEDNGATLLYSGHAAGRDRRQDGGGSNHLCLPEEPQWKDMNIVDERVGRMNGVEYGVINCNIFASSSSAFRNKPTPCAVCYAAQRSASVMIPARTSCNDGWTQEYTGYLMSEDSYYDADKNNRDRTRHSTSYICVDEAPEVANGTDNQDQALIFPVKVGCGCLPCPVYIDATELPCVVCTK